MSIDSDIRRMNRELPTTLAALDDLAVHSVSHANSNKAHKVDNSKIMQAEPIPPESDSITQDHHVSGLHDEHAPALTVLDGDDMAINAKPPNYLIDDILETDAHGILFGASQSFKSFCALRMAYSVCTGEPFFNYQVFTIGRVLYICGEGKGALGRRLKALHIEVGNFHGNFKYIADIVRIDNEISMATVKTAIDKFKPVLVIFDTFSSLAFNTNENDNSEVAQTLALIRNTCANGITSSFAVHHIGKNGALGERGASAFSCNTEFRFELKRETDTMITTLSCPKQKDGEPFAPIHMKAEVIPLGLIKQNGKEATSLVLKPCDDTEKPSKNSKSLNGRQADVLNALHKALEQHGIAPTNEIKALFPDSPYNTPDKVVHSDKWRELAYKIICVDSGSKDIAEAKRRAFNYCTEKLRELNRVGFYDDHYWII